MRFAAALRRLSKAWPPLVVVGALLSGSALLWFGLQPGQPNLPAHQRPEEQQPGYQPGGPGCDPARLARLTIPSREAADERERCAEAAEDYRLKADDLVQQTRSADAAEAIVGLTYDQSRMALAGLALGFVTMAAAIAAAVYARQAASETRRGADAAAAAAQAAAAANAPNREALLADQRPWLKVKVGVGGPLRWNHNGCNLEFIILVENTGRTSALNVEVEIRIIHEPGTLNFERDQRILADEIRHRGPIDGTTIFPGEKTRLDQGYCIGNEHIEVAIGKTKILGQVNPWVHFYVVGCVNYYSPIDEQRNHQTGFIYQLVKNVDGAPNVAIGPTLGDIPAEKLMLVEWLRPGRVD